MLWDKAENLQGWGLALGEWGLVFQAASKPQGEMVLQERAALPSSSTSS